MFAVIQTGGKQYKVHQGSKISVEKIDLAVGNDVIFNEIMLLDDGKETLVGTPFVSGASVVCTLLEQKRDKKVLVFKKRRRKNSRRKTGHRQRLTVLEIKEIKGRS